jgi:arabinose-5-phosphate isomerase
MSTNLALQCIERQIEALRALPTLVETSEEYKKIVTIVTEVALSEHGARVLLAGVGKNSNIASKVSQTMASLGIPSMPLNVSHLGHGDYGFIGKYDVIIHISRSGMTREMLEGIEHISLIRPFVTQILIHCKAGKVKNEHAEIELFLPDVLEGDEHGLAPTTSTTALLCILDCISVQASANIEFERLDFLKFHPDGALGEMLKAEKAKKVHTDISAAVPVEGVPINDPAIAALVTPESAEAARKLVV